MKRPRSSSQTSALVWIEEASHLLRAAPSGVLAIYYLGAVPFVLGLLYFWADMSQSPFAAQRVVPAALGLSVVFLWMKTCQAIFCLRLREILSGRELDGHGPAQWLRVLVSQAILQPLGLVLIPIALVATVPFAWVYGFYQNATAFGVADAAGPSLSRRAAAGTRFLSRQYHAILLVLLLFALLVLLNWTAVGALLPGLLKMLAGVETSFSRSTSAMLNSTFLAAVLGLTYLSVDPLVKALHVLRCFRGEAQTTGDDLKAELHRSIRLGGALTAAVAALLLMGAIALAGAQELEKVSPVAPAVSPATLPPAELDRTIDDVINQQKYTWRMPREKVAKPEAAEEGAIAKFFKRLRDMVRDTLRAMADWFEKIFRGTPAHKSVPLGSFGAGLGGLAHGLLYVLIALAVVALVYLVYRVVRNRHRQNEVVEALPIQMVPDLADENLSAAQLPEDEWTRLARELLAKGELRLALRAFYLSSLACLAGRQLITLAKFKSNRDYEQELVRRGHALAELPGLFRENVLTFDRVWYGLHVVDVAAVSQFASNVERIRSAS